MSTSATASSTTGRCKASAARLDRYVASLNVPPATYAGWSREQQMAFWVNAYNAFVLQTVIDQLSDSRRERAYPATASGRSPARSNKAQHRAAGRSVTLDEIEKTILPEFKEPRLYLALGRGAVGSGRLRSEAYTGERLEQQLDDIQAEFVTRTRHDQDRPGADRVCRDADRQLARGGFIAAYDKASRAVRAALADRARDHRVHHAAPAAARKGVRPEEQVPRDVHAFRLAAQRPDRRAGRD